jgi:Outer membrane lipoprotein carrier protein LolA-like
MTPHRRATALTLFSALVLTFATAPAQAQRTMPTPEWGLQPLMAALRQVPTSNAHFVETKYLHILNQAQRSSGQLRYVAPNWLQKQTTEPVASRLTISGDRLTIEQQGEPNREISLHDYSEIGALVESVRATLAGDLPALTRYFTATLEGNPNAWTLALTPREPRLRELVAAIRIRGERTVIRAVDTTEADGDRTEMIVTPEPK